ncbi:putative UPF0481 protein At3g02645 isoform X1 [Camellia sinensis]|uniref:putative UPF0481 protein At3g02645 isoform X1 n=1 Tax=Camellia sinensis TaxID=4442 RepID=UPI001035F129|nr:putative UPF0481 protein At3g02645 isoform X1 [Camellia sinensis]
MALNKLFNSSEQRWISEISDRQTSFGMDSIFGSSCDSEKRWWTQVSKILEKDQVKTNGVRPVSIFRVPKTLSAFKPDAYMPLLMGLGPYHRFRPELYEMERYKLVAATKVRSEHFPTREFQELVDTLKEKEDEIRSHYHMYLDYDGNMLLWFMTIDGLFLLEFLHTCISKKDRLSSSWSRKPNLFESEGSKFAGHSILRDVVMLENQIPIFLLGNIFDFLNIDKNVLLSMVVSFCSEVSPFKLIKKDLSLSEVYEHDHLLKLLYHLIVMNVKVPKEACPINMPSGALSPEEEIHPKVNSGSQILCSLLKVSSNLNIPLVKKITKPINMIVNLPWATAKSLPEVSRLATNLEEGLKSECDPLGEDIKNPIVEEIMIPSVSALCNAGVEFCLSNGDISIIKFDKKQKKFYLPHLKLNVNSEVIIRNLVAFEASMSDFLVLGRYTELMNGIIDTAEDAKLLKKKGIIEYSLKTDAEVAHLFNGMTRSIRPSKVPYIDIAIEDVNKYYYGTRKVKVYTCMKKYVYGSWQILTLLAAVFVVLLMGMQSFCSVYSCSRFFNVSNDLGK